MEVGIKSYSNAKVIAIIFVFGIILFFARFPQPVITPTIYAEDGVWIGSALSNGWLDTFIHARPDYFVFFNILFLWCASLLSHIFSGSPLLLLPFFISFLSYSFYSLSSVIIFLTVNRFAGKMMAFLAYGMSIFIPLGYSQAESIGTLVQIGFYMPVLSLCSHLYRDDISSVRKRIICDVLIFLMAATNPVCFAVTGIYFVIGFLSTENKKRLIISFFPLLIALLVLFMIIVPRMNGSGGVIGEYNVIHLIEMVTARSLLYPFIFPFYSKMSNASSIILTMVYATVVVLSFFKAEKRSKIAILMFAAMLVIYDAATAAGRSGITGLLTGYGATYPDRYFMGINIISSTLMVICFGQFKKSIVKYTCVLVMMIVYASGIHMIFESSQDKQRIALDYIYTNALCNAKDEGNGFSRIQILPSPDWYIRVPSENIKNLGCVK
ncbi:hypothetical protein NFJ49_10095 [Citrobacter braakii]|uniref:hypothetical protein n=1 Tax=Citrobacter braakii TaxID=57706 RepID=UPI0019059C77|nr:hypothetical protein [Citrobacter braakii]MBJ8971309.1 hypothetical protein [Citrobacter braakii]WFV83175.1 hypothetical protein NFJ49_10095 [Citrobacter braakii]